jgi:hypothetical protein
MSDVLLLFASGAISVAVSRLVKLKMLAMLIVFSEYCKNNSVQFSCWVSLQLAGWGRSFVNGRIFSAWFDQVINIRYLHFCLYFDPEGGTTKSQVFAAFQG